MKMKEKVEDVDNQPNDLKMKQKVVEVEDFFYPPYDPLEKSEEFQVVSKVREREEDYVGESSKRTRTRTRTRSPEVLIDLSSSDSTMKEEEIAEPLKLVEEIVRVYSSYIDHIFVMARDRFKDEQRWNFDRAKCGRLAEICLQKVQRLRSELERMNKDLIHSIIQPRITQIMSQLETMHQRFDCSPNISASAKPNCTKQQLISSMDELNHFKKQLYDITLGL